jgi:hypothetical protein
MVTQLSAQDKVDPRKNSLQEGTWALQFTIDRDFQLSSFQGATISLKKHRSDGSAWRLGLGLALAFDRFEEFSLSKSIGKRDTDENSQAINIIIQKIVYLDPDASINFFYGYGPKASYSHSNSKRTDTTPPPSIASSKREIALHSFSAGISGVVGVEWFATESISILAEYGTILAYSTSKRTSTSRSTSESGTTNISTTDKVSNGFSLSADAVKFSLSAYF